MLTMAPEYLARCAPASVHPPVVGELLTPVVVGALQDFINIYIIPRYNIRFDEDAKS